MKAQYIKIDESGNKFYYFDREMTIHHHEDGPAIEGYYITEAEHKQLNAKETILTIDEIAAETILTMCDIALNLASALSE